MRRRATFITCLLLALAALWGTASARQFTLVIDAGHGGKDAGACGALSKEKNLTLRYALAFGQMVEQNCPDVKVVYTRKTDRFLELWQRAEIANKNKADLFISVHINSLPKGRTARGFQTYTLGKGRTTGKGFIENLEVAKRENSVILLEKNYKQTYHGYDPNSPESDIMFEFIQDDNMERSVELARLMQKHVCAATGRKDMGAHQDNLAVLRLTSMPGCLIELGFISTKDEEAFMNSKEATERYARGIFNAFVSYKKSRGGGSVAAVVPEQEAAARAEEPAVAPAVTTLMAQPDTPAESETVFKVQFMASGQQLKAGSAQFKGLSDVDCYKEGTLWKYTVGASADYNDMQRLRKEVAQMFPQAFVVAFRDGQKVDTQAAIQEFKRKQ